MKCAQDDITESVIEGEVALSDEEEGDGHVVDAQDALGEGIISA